jgi:hypothetical protein
LPDRLVDCLPRQAHEPGDDSNRQRPNARYLLGRWDVRLHPRTGHWFRQFDDHGTVTFYADGSFDYTPDSSSAPVSDSFTYVLTGASGAPALTDNRATVTLDFQNANTVRVDHYALAEDGAKLKFTVHLDRAAGDTATVTVPYSVTRDSYNNLTGGASSNGGFATGVLTFSGSDSSHDVEITVPDDIDVGNDIFEFQLLSNEDLTYAGIDSESSFGIGTATHQQTVTEIGFHQGSGNHVTALSVKDFLNTKNWNDLSTQVAPTDSAYYDSLAVVTVSRTTAIGGSQIVSADGAWQAASSAPDDGPLQTGQKVITNFEQLKGATISAPGDPLSFYQSLLGDHWGLTSDAMGIATSAEEIRDRLLRGDTLDDSIGKLYLGNSSIATDFPMENLAIPNDPVLTIDGIEIRESAVVESERAKFITKPVAAALRLNALEAERAALISTRESWLPALVGLAGGADYKAFYSEMSSRTNVKSRQIDKQQTQWSRLFDQALAEWNRTFPGRNPQVFTAGIMFRSPRSFADLVKPESYDLNFVKRDREPSQLEVLANAYVVVTSISGLSELGSFGIRWAFAEGTEAAVTTETTAATAKEIAAEQTQLAEASTNGGIKTLQSESTLGAGKVAPSSIAKNGETAATIAGKAAHKAYRAGDVLDGVRLKEFRLPSGNRIDFIDFENKFIYELKPNNPRAIKLGQQQLAKYLREVESLFGTGWQTILDTY